MAKKNKQVDAYITKAADHAKPVLKYLRNLVHEICPDVQEGMKWGFPHFDYKGMMCSMAAFKQHCAFNFWKYALMKDAKEMLENNEKSMGHLGKIASLEDLPPARKIKAWIKEAMQLNEQNIKVTRRKKPADITAIVLPEILEKALQKDKKAAATFSAFSPSHKKEYIEWINEAKTEDTKNRRLATTLEWLSEGKKRNWKYERK